LNCASTEKYDISIVFVEKNTNQRIIWEISKDISSLFGKFYPVMNFKIASKGPTDADGYVYKTVKIGSQIWFAENLRTSKYNDGTPLPYVTDNTQWSNLSTGGWCYYNNDPSYNAKYGKLYNWYAVSPTMNGNKNVCPSGWHVPTDSELTILTDYLGGVNIAGGKMKEAGTTSWDSSNSASNTSLFSALPGGTRNPDNGSYLAIGNHSYLWSSSEQSQYAAWARLLYSSGYNINISVVNFRWGLSVRCLRD
jgi:uncharacterized protein (TIGR02145 family)